MNIREKIKKIEKKIDLVCDGLFSTQNNINIIPIY